MLSITRKKKVEVTTADHVADVVAAIEAGAPAPEPELSAVEKRTLATPKPVKPVNVVQDGKGAFRLVKVGDHQAEYRWDENAIAPAMALPLSADIRSLLFIVAKQTGLDKQAFVAWCSQNTPAVRAAARVHRDGGGQWTAFEGLVKAYRETTPT